MTNMSESPFGTDETFWLRVFKLVCYGIVFLLGMVGNTAVIWLVFGHSSRLIRTAKYNYCLAHLAISDLAVLSINLPFRLAYQENGYEWPFGFAMCKIIPPLTFVFITASSSFLVIVSWDRYRAVVRPFKRRFHGNQLKIAAPVAVWFFSFLFASPLYAFMTTMIRNGRTVCTDVWPTVESEKLYFVSLFFLLFVMPVGFTAVVYVRMILVMKGNKFAQTGSRSLHRRIKMRNSRVVRMLLIVVLLHFLCILPYNTYLVLSVFHVRAPSLLKQFLVLLAIANSMANPYIYWIFGRQYRKAFWDMINNCQCRRNRSFQVQKKVASNGDKQLTDDSLKGDMSRKEAPMDTCPSHSTKVRFQLPVVAQVIHVNGNDLVALYRETSV